jgi:Ras family protein T1
MHKTIFSSIYYIILLVTLEKIPGIIIDYSSREQNENDLIKEIERANVLCLVYAINDVSSKEKLVSYWLPKIQEIESNAMHISSSASLNSSYNGDIYNTKRPIILIANKSDIIINNESLVNDFLISQLIRSYNQIETCIQCSAKTLKNVPEVFYYAQKSILYPTVPIYDEEKKTLTSQCIKCLTRIFKLCDHDNDGLLNDKELNEFQMKCFGVHLNNNSLQEVKTLLNNNFQRSENLFENSITLNGFLYLHSLFIKKGRHETIWAVLKKFGYDKHLSMSHESLTIK